MLGAALGQLAAEIPPAVVASTLGISATTATPWAAITGGDWARYALDTGGEVAPTTKRPYVCHHRLPGFACSFRSSSRLPDPSDPNRSHRFSGLCIDVFGPQGADPAFQLRAISKGPHACRRLTPNPVTRTVGTIAWELREFEILGNAFCFGDERG